MSNWFQQFQNPRSFVIKKYLADVLQDRYPKSEKIIDRMSYHLVTEDDIQQFLQMIIDIYELAYSKSVKDHKEALEKAGIHATMVPGSQNRAENSK